MLTDSGRDAAGRPQSDNGPRGGQSEADGSSSCPQPPARPSDRVRPLEVSGFCSRSLSQVRGQVGNLGTDLMQAMRIVENGDGSATCHYEARTFLGS